MELESRIAVIIIVFEPSSSELENIRHVSSLYKGVIVDNSSTSNFTAKSVNKMRYVALGENVGIAKAQNIGIEYVLRDESVDYVFYFDQDSVFCDDYPLKMVREYECIKAHGINIAALGPTVVQKETGETYKSVIHKDRKINSHFIQRKEVIASGCCFRTAVFKDVGVNDASLFIDFVDCEWCWRAYSKGYVCGITPNVTIYHKVGRKEMHIGRHIIIVSAPFRYYYQYRNYMVLLRRSYVPLQWKVNKGVKFFLRYIFFPFVVEDDVKCWKYMSKGLLAGIKAVFK